MMEDEQIENDFRYVRGLLTEVCRFSNTIIITLDKNGVIQQFNDVAENALGYHADDVIGLHTPMLFHLEDELDRKAAVMQVELSESVRTNFITVSEKLHISGNDWHYVCQDGSTIFVSVSIRPFNECRISGEGYLLMAANIPEEKRPERELMAALKKERELNELKSRFVSMASHEFRTPLGGILSSTYLISKYKRKDQQLQREKHIGHIVSSVQMLTEILDDFLSVGKIEAGKIQPKLVKLDVKAHTEKMIREVKHLLKHSQKIIYEHIGAETVFELDPSMLKHILMNLLANAIKFSTDESNIEISTESRGGNFTLKVKDHGIGIPKNEQNNLFKIFFRSSFSVNMQGTGLGLHIVKKYAELMGGHIHFKSEIGEGTEFIIQFNATKN